MYACEMKICCYSNVKYFIRIKFHIYQSTWLVVLFNYYIPPWLTMKTIADCVTTKTFHNVLLNHPKAKVYHRWKYKHLLWTTSGRIERIVAKWSARTWCKQQAWRAPFYVTSHPIVDNSWFANVQGYFMVGNQRVDKGAPFVLHTQYPAGLRCYRRMCTHANTWDGCSKIMSFVRTWQHLMGFKKWAHLHQRWQLLTFSRKLN